MRVLLSGVIGAAVAAAAWMAIEHSTKQEFGWMAIVVGVVTGLAVHCAASTGSRSSIARGALAAVLALAASVGCRQVYAKVMEKSDSGAAAAVAAAPADPSGSETEDSQAEEVAEPAKLALSLEKQNAPGAAVYGAMSFKKGLTQWDMLWLSMSALSAYVVGKGRDRVAPSDEAAKESPDTPA